MCFLYRQAVRILNMFVVSVSFFLFLLFRSLLWVDLRSKLVFYPACLRHTIMHDYQTRMMTQPHLFTELTTKETGRHGLLWRTNTIANNPGVDELICFCYEIMMKSKGNP